MIVNVENAAGGFGVTPEVLDELRRPADRLLHHRQPRLGQEGDRASCSTREPRLLRPANYPEGNPGRGLHVGETAAGIPVGVAQPRGPGLHAANVDSPFRVADRLLAGLDRGGARSSSSTSTPRRRARSRRSAATSTAASAAVRRHPHPRADRRRADPARRHGLPDRRRHDRAVRGRSSASAPTGCSSASCSRRRPPSRSPRATSGWPARWSTSTRRPARRGRSSGCWWPTGRLTRDGRDPTVGSEERAAKSPTLEELRPAPGRQPRLGDRHHLQRGGQHRRVPRVGARGPTRSCSSTPSRRTARSRSRARFPVDGPAARVLRLGGAEELGDRPRAATTGC